MSNNFYFGYSDNNKMLTYSYVENWNVSHLLPTSLNIRTIIVTTTIIIWRGAYFIVLSLIYIYIYSVKVS